MTSIKQLSAQHFDWVEKMGWHNKTPLEALALVASEVGEAVNECRGEKPTDAFGEELADIVLRVMDLAYWQGVDLEQEIVNKIAKNELRGNRGRLK
jgi:NTP pyrophosphatase (non-canonical NTP hydrolase)